MHEGTSSVSVDDFFLDEEIEDSQLRMIFTACYPQLNPKAQISFALKIIAGFSRKEIASALLIKEGTIKKNDEGSSNYTERANFFYNSEHYENAIEVRQGIRGHLPHF